MRVLIADNSDFMLDRLQQMLVSLDNVEVVWNLNNVIDTRLKRSRCYHL